MIPWHRLFGLTLTDYFHDTSYNVEIEKDLSMRKQLLDVVVLESKEGVAHGELEEVPDGLEELGSHNLITFKSHDQSLDHWAVEELGGHYVNYRKQASPSLDKLLPEDDFRLYAVCVRFPANLSRECDLRYVKDGVYDFRWGVRTIRAIVTGQVEEVERNLPWPLFSVSPEKVLRAMRRYRWKIPASRIRNKLWEKYVNEELFMTYTIEDFDREVMEDWLKSLTKEDIDKFLKSLGPEERLRGLGPEERLRGLGPEERLRGLGPEERLRGLEELLKSLGPEELSTVLSPELLRKVLKPEVVKKYLKKRKSGDKP